MEEKKRLQIFKLTNWVVSTSGSLLAFFAHNTHTDVSLQNHSNIICTISNGQSSFILVSISDKLYDISFLLRGHTACQHYVNLVTNFQKFLFAISVINNLNKRRTGNDKCLHLRFLFLFNFNLSLYFTQFRVQFFWFSLINNVLSHFCIVI